MGGGSGSSGGGDTTTTVRYAEYIEDHHKTFLDVSEAAGDTAREDNPYTTHFVPFAIDSLPDAFFGAGFSIASFPSLYDMYGKFMAGLDVELLWTQVLAATQDDPTVTTMSQAHADLLSDDIEDTALPRFQQGMRDINAVMSSTYVIGKALIESARIKSIAKFDAEIRYKLIPIAAERWRAHLGWNQQMISTYTTMINQFYNSELAVDSYNMENFVKESLWPFTVLDQERANIAAMQGAQSNTAPAGGEASSTQKAIGGMLSGAAAGSAVPGVGTVAGGIIGLAASFF